MKAPERETTRPAWKLRWRGGIFLALTLVPAGSCSHKAKPAATNDDRQTFPSAVPLTVRGAPAGAEVWAEGGSLGPASQTVSLPYSALPLEVKVTAPGYQPATLSVTSDRAREIIVHLSPIADGGSDAHLGVRR